MNVRPLRVMIPAAGVLSLLYTLKIRPWMLRWGATEDEGSRPLPGDDLVANPTHVTTHAITINARPEEIWPWLIQMGQDRAGFYAHNWVETLLLSGIPDIHEIHPEWQHLAVGDIMRTNREIKGGHPIGWSVLVVEPNRLLVVGSKSFPAGTWALILEPIDAGSTRLISRDRAVWQWWQSPFRLLIFEPLHAYMQTGVLQGVKARAERMRSGTSAGGVTVATQQQIRSL